MASFVKIRSQEIISLVEEVPSIDDRDASELMYLICAVARDNQVNIQSAEEQQRASHGSQCYVPWHPEQL